MWHVYALRSIKDGDLYVGISQDPQRRLRDHNSGMTKSVKSRRPFRIVFQEKVGDRFAARKREKYLKSGVGREFLRQFI